MVVADDVVRTAAAVKIRGAESAQRVAHATADAASFSAASVVAQRRWRLRKPRVLRWRQPAEAMAVAEEVGIDTEIAIELAQDLGCC
jgi:hypothetical protein